MSFSQDMQFILSRYAVYFDYWTKKYDTPHITRDQRPICKPAVLRLPHGSYLSEFAEQLRDTGQPLRGPFEVSVLKNQLNQLRVAGAHSLLQN